MSSFPSDSGCWVVTAMKNGKFWSGASAGEVMGVGVVWTRLTHSQRPVLCLTLLQHKSSACILNLALRWYSADRPADKPPATVPIGQQERNMRQIEQHVSRPAWDEMSGGNMRHQG